MSEGVKEGEEVLQESISFLKKLKTRFPGLKLISYILAFISMGGGTMFIWIWDKSQDHIIKVATPKIIHLSDSISKGKINHVLDSINYANKLRGSLRTDLSFACGVDRDSFVSVFGRWYKREGNLYNIGLYGNYKTHKVLYKHVNGYVYRAIFKPQKDYYYYINDRGEWKQVK